MWKQVGRHSSLRGNNCPAYLYRHFGMLHVPASSRPAEGGRLRLPCVLALQDLENIEAGLYKLPWDMTTVTHKQYNPFYMIRR